jgi:hypothetical protein
VLLGADPRDQRLWQSLRGQLLGVLDGFPPLELYEIEPCGGMGGARSLIELFEQVERADPLIVLLSPEFLDSPRCMAMAERGLARRTLALVVQVRPCMIEQGGLARVKRVPEDGVEHKSLYAREQRILEVAKEVRRLVVGRLLEGRRGGRMSLELWLLWQLYGQGGQSAPCFEHGGYLLRNLRASGLSGIIVELVDTQQERMLAEYVIGPLSCPDLERLLARMGATAGSGTAQHAGEAHREPGALRAGGECSRGVRSAGSL